MKCVGKRGKPKTFASERDLLNHKRSRHPSKQSKWLAKVRMMKLKQLFIALNVDGDLTEDFKMNFDEFLKWM